MLPRLCLECGFDIPDDDHGALSRVDNSTIICSECGILQALRDYYQHADARRTAITDDTETTENN